MKQTTVKQIFIDIANSYMA